MNIVYKEIKNVKNELAKIIKKYSSNDIVNPLLCKNICNEIANLGLDKIKLKIKIYENRTYISDIDLFKFTEIVHEIMGVNLVFPKVKYIMDENKEIMLYHEIITNGEMIITTLPKHCKILALIFEVEHEKIKKNINLSEREKIKKNIMTMFAEKRKLS